MNPVSRQNGGVAGLAIKLADMRFEVFAYANELD
jgi:hypothetical protein